MGAWAGLGGVGLDGGGQKGVQWHSHRAQLCCGLALNEGPLHFGVMVQSLQGLGSWSDWMSAGWKIVCVMKGWFRGRVVQLWPAP